MSGERKHWANHCYLGEFPGWCECGRWCQTESDYEVHVGLPAVVGRNPSRAEVTNEHS